MALLAVIGIVYGVLVGLKQTDLKFVIGYSSVIPIWGLWARIVDRKRGRFKTGPSSRCLPTAS
jgi:hypothetical protein